MQVCGLFHAARPTARPGSTLVATAEPTAVHAAWLPKGAFRALGSRHSVVQGDGPLVDTVLDELRAAARDHGGSVRHVPPGETLAGGTPPDVILALSATPGLPAAAAAVRDGAGSTGREGFALARRDGVTVLLADAPAGLLYGLFHLVRLGES